MQLTSAVFLFFILPLSLPLVLLLPKRYRRLALSLLSILIYVLANSGNPWGILQIGALVCLTVTLAYLPTPHSVGSAKFRSALLVAVALSSFIGARVVDEYFNTPYSYPVGLLFVTLGIISYVFDYARGDVIRPRNPLELVGYLLFFPTLTVGPIVRSKHYFDRTEDIGIRPALLTEGLRSYMLGYIKRVAIAAVLMRAIQDLLDYNHAIFSPTILIALLLCAFLFFYFFISGSADLARGVCGMCGIALPRDRSNALSAPTPDHMLYGTVLSLRSFLLDYVKHPLCGKKNSKKRRALSLLLIYCITVLVLRVRAELLLIGLPILLFSLLVEFTPVRGLLTAKRRWRWLLSPLSLLICSLFALSLLLPAPLDLFPLIASAFTVRGNYPPTYILGVVQDANYLLFLMILLAVFLPWGYLRRFALRKVSDRTALLLSIVEISLLFAGFILTLIYFLPQFPSYVEYAFHAGGAP
ncbi:MAG: hypothetical protein J6A84_02795 [Clostridia bacterium]|nr:hypothetical protein [Clostridia bacterium]